MGGGYSCAASRTYDANLNPRLVLTTWSTSTPTTDDFLMDYYNMYRIIIIISICIAPCSRKMQTVVQTVNLAELRQTPTVLFQFFRCKTRQYIFKNINKKDPNTNTDL